MRGAAMAVRTQLSNTSLTSSCRNITSPNDSNLWHGDCCKEKIQEVRWLGNFEEVPEYQRKPYIHWYYRLEAPRMRHFWRVHNELGNMWTHLFAAAVTLIRFRSWWQCEPTQDATAAPSLVWTRQTYAAGVATFFFGSLITFCISVMYHWRHCGKELEVKCWLCLDISCCGLLLLLGFAAGVPMGFHCYPELQKGYMLQAVTVALAAVCAFAFETPATRGRFSSPTLILGGISALWPALHWLMISTAGRQAAGGWLLVVIVCGILATLFYTKSIPECFAPGRFDLLCNSHQLWHVFIYGAIAAYAEALIAVFKLTASSSFCQ